MEHLKILQAWDVLQQVEFGRCLDGLDRCCKVGDFLSVVVAAVTLHVNGDFSKFPVTEKSLIDEHRCVEVSEDQGAGDVLLKHQVGKVDVTQVRASHAEVEGDMALCLLAGRYSWDGFYIPFQR